jgi:hypothetical protein
MKVQRGWHAVAITTLAFHSLLSVTPTSAQEQFRELWRVGNWQGYLFTIPSGHFDRCTAVVHYTNGVTLGFSIDKYAQLAMRVTTPDDLPVNASSRLSLTIDGRQFGSLAGSNTSRNQAMYELGRRYDLIRGLKRGQVLSLSGEVGNWDLSLRDSSRALSHMAECIPGTVTASNTRRGIASAPLPPDANPGQFAFGSAEDPFNEIVQVLVQD